jgi:alginate O-acetyltransferase complex protein AlgI
VGLVKKFMIADFLTSLTDHLNDKDIILADRWVLLLWLFSYGWKIYFDFSAYSDIAIGSGRLFGIRIPENFDWPYFRTSISSFWQHWHISLYRWLVDYIFIPIGGSRGTLSFVCRNILIVMLVSGIWHGAALHFVAWGLWHGILLVIHRIWGTLYKKNNNDNQTFTFSSFIGWFLTYVSVNIGWAFFAMDIKTSMLFFQKLILG